MIPIRYPGNLGTESPSPPRSYQTNGEVGPHKQSTALEVALSPKGTASQRSAPETRTDQARAPKQAVLVEQTRHETPVDR